MLSQPGRDRVSIVSSVLVLGIKQRYRRRSNAQLAVGSVVIPNVHRRVLHSF